jgi:hypothetical protein
MAVSVTAHIFQVYSTLHASPAQAVRRIASLVRSPEYAKLFSAILKHLRHERQRLELPVLVQRGKDLLLASHFHQFPGYELSVINHRNL